MSPAGLSPRVRGNPKSIANRYCYPRSIPACAGEPKKAGSKTAAGRSIPACAGEPRRIPCPHPPSWVYPRVCGGTHRYASVDVAGRGLSPRVRGNLHPVPFLFLPRRSIPACAGEPLTACRLSTATTVYPRVCGGTVHARCLACCRHGLSPRVRRNLVCGARPAFVPGSIPACAGEPPSSEWARWWCWVYPRVCGGTPAARPVPDFLVGLSPRVRGNRNRGRCTW